MSDPQLAGCRAIAAGLAAAGVTRIVSSPGHRSAPLLFALLRQPGLRVTTVVDERSAGFVALGAARASGGAVALLCTSGSAGGHYLPALMEARESGIPLVAITADRPTELQELGVNQTTGQLELFGGHVAARDSLEFPAACDSDLADPGRAALSRVRALCQHAQRHSAPVHLNVRLRKPFFTEAAWQQAGPVPTVRGERARLVDPAAGHRVREFVGASARGLIVDGPPFGPYAPRHRERLRALSRALGWPLLADVLAPTHGASEALPLHPLWLDSLPAALVPERILWFGRLPTATPMIRFLERTGAPILQLHRGPHALDGGIGAEPVYGDAGCLDAPPTAALDKTWAAAWQAESERGRDWHRRQSARLSWEAPALQQLLDRWPYRYVQLGNSSIVRDVEAYVRTPARHRYFGNRGLSGIDGTMGSAWGAALALGEPVLAIVGDVTFAHDVGSLLHAPADVPLAVAVLDNGGGQIFSRLPVADLAEFEEHYLTPPSFDGAAIARAAGWQVYDEPERELRPRTLTWLRVGGAVAHRERERASSALRDRRAVTP